MRRCSRNQLPMSSLYDLAFTCLKIKVAAIGIFQSFIGVLNNLTVYYSSEA